MARNINALALVHGYLKKKIKPGNICVDATMGRGRDTLFLCELVGEQGQVFAFDIQPQALESTKELLQTHHVDKRATLLLQSHNNMSVHIPQQVDCIMFNFGWLPGGDHSIFTKPQTSIEAICAGLEHLVPNGVMTLILYYGGDSGYEERDALLEFLPTISSDDYTVLISTFANRPNDPPIPVFILKNDKIN